MRYSQPAQPGQCRPAWHLDRAAAGLDQLAVSSTPTWIPRIFTSENESVDTVRSQRK